MMGNKRNQISIPWFQVIVFLCLIEILAGFVVEAKTGNGIVLDPLQAQNKDEERDGNANLGAGSSRTLFSSKIDDVSKSNYDRDANVKVSRSYAYLGDDDG